MNLKATLAGLAVFALAVPSHAIVETFEAPAGTVIAGQTPNGGTASGLFFPGLKISVTNTGGGPQSAIIFDTENPTGGDPDLGTPNESCGGPGVGNGGPCTTCGVEDPTGPNCVPLGKALIIAEDIVDSNNDNIVDDPDDEAGGGTLLFEFNQAIVPIDITILDIDNETAAVDLRGDTLCVIVDATDLGDNSAQTIDLQGFGSFECLEINFSSSGAVAELEYEIVVGVEDRSWGETKAVYRKSE